MDPFDVCQAEHRWNGCDDQRPWLIVDLRQNGQMYGCFPIASECYSGSCFYLDHSDPDFPATGLNKSCYIHDTHIVEIPAGKIIRKRGALVNALLKNFRDFAGV